MSNKSKICTTALATHVEQCFPGYVYASLVVTRLGDLGRKPDESVGLRNVIERELGDKISAKMNEIRAQEVDATEIAQKFLSAGTAQFAKAGRMKFEIDPKTRDAIEASVVSFVEAHRTRELEALRSSVIADAGSESDLNQLDDAIEARIERIYKEAKFDSIVHAEFTPIKGLRPYEMPQLGMFFSEATCFRCEGLTYSPCGKESSIRPYESINETFSTEDSLTSETASSVGIVTNIKTTDKETEDTTLTESYDKTIKNTLDLKKSASGNAKGKLFKVIDVGLDTSSSASFNQYIETVNKSSSEIKRSFVNEVVTDITLTHKLSTINTQSSVIKTGYDRKIANPGDQPIHIIERQPHCVYSVIHKRTNVYLAWSGCIDEPGRDLCRPDNLEEKHAAQMQAIRNKWAIAGPPTSFGPRPANERICSEPASQDSFGDLFADNVTFQSNVQASIPAGYGYVPGSATVTVIASDTAVTSTSVSSEPAGGASGFVNFGATVVVNNEFANKESAQFKVCFDVTTPAAKEYEGKVSAWRDEQAQREIDALLTKELTRLNEFLLSDRVYATIEQKLFEKYFGLGNTQDCCALIKRIRSIFDFDLLSFTLLPTWNDIGAGCQSTEPVTIYTARCLNFYLPVRPGKEWEALAVLLSINVLSNIPDLISQVGGYINSIVQMRQTLFNRVFDPSGWEVKIDGPNGYSLTSYDAAISDWSADFESSLNYQLIDINVITVPCGGPRKELRQNIC